jgi:hypothetical protein
VPSWATVLRTTLRLWAQRHLSRSPGQPSDTRPWRRRLAMALVVLGTAAAVAVALIVTQVLPKSGSGPNTGNRASRGASGALGAVAASRQQAARWIVSQVSKAAIVSCDPMMCRVLAAHGFPPGNLMPLTPGSGSPWGSEIVVATAAVRSQFGRELTTEFAPGIVAAFGSGAAGIQVRAIAVLGGADFVRQLRADVLARQQAGAQLLRNPHLRATAAARKEMAAGQVDSRILITLATLADRERVVKMLGFGDAGPGASPGMPLRSATLAIPGTGAASRHYLQDVLAFLREQVPPTRALRINVQKGVQNGIAGTDVTFEFSAPIVFKVLPTAPS